ncbi:secretory phospholipase A2 receptor-like [Montipora foliosa]|uniref:secretory phospholipase A2 receptor-like n=1 Tax=Montipora foliosa TaxID=591990 RepID=UPI0035F19428
MQPTTDNHPMRTTNYLPLIPARCFLLLVSITTLDCRPIVADHLIINRLDTLRYISEQTVCPQTLSRSPILQESRCYNQMKTEMKMFASLPLYIVTTLFAFGCVSALPRVHKQHPRILPSMFKQDSGKCPEFWHEFQEHCYKVHKSIKSWDDAEGICGKDDAEIVTITSSEENEFVKRCIVDSELASQAWIGLKEAFYWKGGSEPSYTDWASGHPKVQADSCVWMNAAQDGEGSWYDVPCEGAENVGVVCKKPF